MKILIVSKSQWDETNSLGNTLSNLFSGISNESLAHLYFRSAKPDNSTCNTYFSISDKDILKTIISRKSNIGNFFEYDYSHGGDIETNINNVRNDEYIYSYFRQKNSKIALILQQCIWNFGRWESIKLLKFLGEYKPEIIFAPCFSTVYLHKILWRLQEITNAKLVLFHADDYLTVPNNGLLNKIIGNKVAEIVKESALKANINYCISHKQKDEYERKIGKEMKLLYKGANFSEKPAYMSPDENSIIRITYIGSILYGRWKTLALLANEIDKINKKRRVFELSIYSQYEPSDEIMKQIVIDGASIFKGKIPAREVQNEYIESDIVLHIESFDDIEKQKTRLSFSTKIVDCLNSGRTVMAIGWEEAASIDYLKQNEAALVVTDENEITNVLNNINNNRSLLEVYANKAWECGKKNHQISEIQKKLYQEFKNVLESDNT